MTKPRFNMGIIGCGFIAEQQARALSGIPEIKVCALADRHLEGAVHFKAKMGLNDCRCFQDYRELLAMKWVDFVSISVPNRLHKEVLFAAAAAGKHVMCEKPLANNLQDVDEMIEVMDQRKLKFAVYHESSFYPENLFIRQLLEREGSGITKFAWLGALAVGKWNLTPWRLDPAISGGGIVMDEGIHLAHLAKFYFRQKPVRVSAFIDRIGRQESSVEDTATMTFEFPTGIAQANTSLMPMIGRDQNMKTYSQGIITDSMSIELIFANAAEGVYSPVQKVLVTTAAGSTEHTMPAYTWPLEKNIDSFKRLYIDFMESVMNDRAPYVDGKGGRDAMEMVMASYASAALGKPVQLPMEPASPVYKEGVLGLEKLESQISPDSILRKKKMYGLGPT